jgi:hypothetical protein
VGEVGWWWGVKVILGLALDFFKKGMTFSHLKKVFLGARPFSQLDISLNDTKWLCKKD